MRAFVYQQTYDREIDEIDVTDEEIDFGFSWFECGDCEGTGLFTLPDDVKEPCVRCKSKGLLPVNLM